MRKNVILFLILIISILSCDSSNSSAEELIWQTSKADAIALAKSQGKKILLLAGKMTCGNCRYMKLTVCESDDPSIKSLIQNNFIPWFCDLDGDRSDEYRPYAGDLLYTGFIMPLICCIDPNDSDNYLDRTSNIQYPDDFYQRLQGIISASVLAGDVNHKDGINLKDAILSLQTASGIQILSDVYKDADVNGDNKIGIEEAVFSLKYAASGSGGYTRMSK